jgi:hypothetical protein
MTFKDLHALLFRCPYAPARDDILRHLPNISTLELFEVDSISDQGIAIGIERLRSKRGIGC